MRNSKGKCFSSRFNQLIICFSDNILLIEEMNIFIRLFYLLVMAVITFNYLSTSITITICSLLFFLLSIRKKTRIYVQEKALFKYYYFPFTRIKFYSSKELKLEELVVKIRLESDGDDSGGAAYNIYLSLKSNPNYLIGFIESEKVMNGIKEEFEKLGFAIK